MSNFQRSSCKVETNQEIGLPLLMWRDDDGQPMAAGASVERVAPRLSVRRIGE